MKKRKIKLAQAIEALGVRVQYDWRDEYWLLYIGSDPVGAYRFNRNRIEWHVKTAPDPQDQPKIEEVLRLIKDADAKERERNEETKTN